MTSGSVDAGTAPAPGGEFRSGQRNEALDVLRGFAVLGILFMNLPGYGLISADYLNPTASGWPGLADWLAWGFTHVFTEQKFMTLFCLLFGAGVVIASSRAEQAGLGAWPPFLRRSAALLALGLVHAYGIWYGDVLATYAVAAFIPFLLRRRSARTLHIVGIVLLALPFLFSVYLGLSFPRMGPRVQAALAAAWTPDAASVAAEHAAYLGSWLAQMPRRLSDAAFLQSYFLLTLFLWRAAGLMLIGMALYKSGFLTGAAPLAHYRRVAAVGTGSGLAIVICGVVYNFSHGWQVQYSMYLGNQFNYWGSVPMALGYAALVVLAVRQRWLPGLRDKLGRLGRATLTLYILHGVIGTLIFYGHGLGLYAQLPRWSLLLLVLPIWTLEYLLVRHTFIGRGPLDRLVSHFANHRRDRAMPGHALPQGSAA
jgi:uncharacterized protein